MPYDVRNHGGLESEKNRSLYPDSNAASRMFTAFANWTAHASGRPSTFFLAVFVILIWAVTGPLFRFSDTWQLVINTGTTIVTFLMVFLIQNTQNRDGHAIQLKLDELVRALDKANNRFVGIEKLTEEEADSIEETCETPERPGHAEHQPQTDLMLPRRQGTAG